MVIHIGHLIAPLTLRQLCTLLPSGLHPALTPPIFRNSSGLFPFPVSRTIHSFLLQLLPSRPLGMGVPQLHSPSPSSIRPPSLSRRAHVVQTFCAHYGHIHLDALLLCFHFLSYASFLAYSDRLHESGLYLSPMMRLMRASTAIKYMAWS